MDGCGVVGPRLGDGVRFHVQSWAGWPPVGDPADRKRIAPLLRRRLTGLGRDGLETAGTLPDLDRARYVFSSRHGEFCRTLTILRSLAAREAVSPTEFSMSVHHALPALLSVSNGNHEGHTAIAGGAESFCFALVEAAALLAADASRPVMVLHCDEPLPEEYAVFERADSPDILALLLSADAGMEVAFSVCDTPAGGEMSVSTSPAQAFRGFLEEDANALSYCGDGRLWKWVRHGVG